MRQLELSSEVRCVLKVRCVIEYDQGEIVRESVAVSVQFSDPRCINRLVCARFVFW